MSRAKGKTSRFGGTPRIYCCGCKTKVKPRLTSGAEIYPHRRDLKELPFWKCDGCGNWVGCHHQTENRTRPVGVIATPEIKNARIHIHAILDPIWKSGKIKRQALYDRIGQEIGRTYHTANIRTIEEARNIYRIVLQLGRSIASQQPLPKGRGFEAERLTIPRH